MQCWEGVFPVRTCLPNIVLEIARLVFGHFRARGLKCPKPYDCGDTRCDSVERFSLQVAIHPM
jgi:hypothetical protein